MTILVRIAAALAVVSVAGARPPQQAPPARPGAAQRPGAAAHAAPLLPAMVVIEAETLVDAAQVSPQAGPPIRQEMAGFGPDWGGNAQLFWRPPAPVDTPIRNWPSITFYLHIADAGRYAIALVYTRAPDFGNARVFVKGQPRGDTIGYAATVRTARIELGDLALDAGNLQLVLTVFAKAQESTGFAIGLDRIELRRK